MTRYAPDPIETLSLPESLDTERMILGAIMTDESAFLRVSGTLVEHDFAIEKHKLIFRRMLDLSERGAPLDRVPLAEELIKHGELQAVDGLSYLVSLDDGFPQIQDLEYYVSIVKEKSALRRVIRISQDTINRAMSGSEDSGKLIASTETALLALGDSQTTKVPVNPGTIVMEYEGGLEAFIDTSRREQGIKTGFLKLDDMTGGFREGELIILAARPGVGKSSLALNIANHIATRPNNSKGVVFFSLEMSRESLLQRMACSNARVDHSKYRCGHLTEEEKTRLYIALGDVAEVPLFIDDSASTNLMEIHGKVRKLQVQHDIGLVIVDYLQLMQSTKRHENRVQEVGALSRGLKLMSKDLKAPLLALSQLNRGPEARAGDHRPMLSDLRESGDLEQSADLVMFIFRPEMYRPDKEELKGIAELILAKQRAGPTGKIKLAWLNRYTQFANLAEDTRESPFE